MCKESSTHCHGNRLDALTGKTVFTTDMEGGFVKWQGEAASTTVAADAASC